MNATAVDNNTVARCSLSNKFGLEIQAILAFVAFCVLIVKRLKEPKKERRSLTIWLCDTSKQGIGAMMIHFVNVFLAELSHEKDPCTLYFINYLLDTTVGLLVIWLFLKILHYVANRKGWFRLRMGEYGDPVEVRTWMYQCAAYVLVMFAEKIVIIIFFQFHFWTTVKKFILKPVSAHPKLEVVLVVLIVPFFMNALMFWVVDNFLMRKRTKLHPLSNTTEELKPVHYSSRRSHSHSDDEAHVTLLSNTDDVSPSDSDVMFRKPRR